MFLSTAVLVSNNIGRNIKYGYTRALPKLYFRQMPKLQYRNFSQKLPKYPVPVLYDTMERYIRSCIPFLTDTEYVRTKKLALELVIPGGTGEKLQRYLEARAKTKENWLADWWINVAYLEQRNSLVFRSSVVQNLPLQRRFILEEDRLEYAAKVILATLNYKKLIEEGNLKADTKENQYLDMQQYNNIFGTNRVPALRRDCMIYNPNSRHIVVAYKNNFYAVNVLASDCARSIPDVDQITSLLKEIVDNLKTVAIPVGLLTSYERDSWARARQNLLEHPLNVESLCLIEKALFLVCLDDGIDSSHDNMTRTAEHLMHGGGVCRNLANRWFDKSIQIVVSLDGISGVIVEQSSIEGRIIANLVDYIAQSLNMDKKRCGTECFPTPKRLCFCYNNEAKTNIEAAAEHITELVRDVDIWCIHYDKFGTDFLKALQVSPNAFMQMVIQYAFYRLHCKPAATSFPGVTRMFLHGRTDIIRSCSKETLAFIRSMTQDKADDLNQMLLLKEAMDHHKAYTKIVVKGGGIDRHLLGLRLAAQTMNVQVPALYEDEAFRRSSHMRLNTAKVQFKCDAVMCMGPLVSDGYGVCYNAQNESMNFTVSSLKSGQQKTSRKFIEELVLCATDMNDLLFRTNKPAL